MSYIYILLLYLFLYTPVFVFTGIDSIYLLYPLLLLFILPRYIKRLHVYKGVFITWFFLFCYVLLRTSFNGDSYFLISSIGLLIESVCLSYIIAQIAIQRNVDLYKLLLIACFIAASISTTCLLVPSFNNLIKGMLVSNNAYLEDNLFRGFGLASELTYTYGLIQGILCAFGILFLNKYPWFAFCIPFVIISVLVNARTGFIPIAIVLFFIIISKRKIKYLLYISAILFVIIFLWNNFLVEYFPIRTVAWINEFFRELLGILSGKENSSPTLEALNNMAILPESTSHWLFGSGQNIFSAPKGRRSDVGYCIQLNYGGIIYCFLLFCFVFSIYHKSRNKIPSVFFITMIISTLLMNYKGTFFAHNSAFTLTVLLSMYSCEINSRNKSYDK